MIKCPQCKHLNPKDGNFCLECGHKLEHRVKPKKYLPIIIVLCLLFGSVFLIKSDIFKNLDNDKNISKSEEPLDNIQENIQLEKDFSISQEEKVLDFELKDWEESIDPIEEEIIIVDTSIRKVNDVYPLKGSPGTVINIQGEGLDHALIGLQLNGVSMPIYNIDQTRVQGIVTSDMSSGIISLSFEDENLEVGSFDIVEPVKTSLLDVLVPVSDQSLIYETDEVRIIIPPGALSQERQLTVERYETTDHVFHMAQEIHPGHAYSIKLGDQKSFDVPLTIEFPNIDDKSDFSPLVMYYEEDSFQWLPISSHITEDSTIQIKTNHLTDFWYDLWYEKVTSPDGFFTVYYEEGDIVSVNGYPDISSLADRIAQIMDLSRKSYDPITGQTLASGQVILVHSDYNRTGGKYSPTSGIIILPTQYTTALGVDTTAAHELFHLYQNLDMSMFTMSKNKWIIEASAEYASHRLAFSKQSYVPQIWYGTSPDVTMTHLNEVHEYSMAAFMDYLFEVEQKEFKDLYKTLLNQPKDQTSAFNNFFKESNQDFFMSTAYESFWRHITTEKNPTRIIDPSKLFIKNKNLNSSGSNLTYKYKAKALDTQQFIKIVPYKMHPNVPVRHIKVTADLINDKPGIAYGLQLLSVPDLSIANIMIPGGLEWDKISNAYYGGTYKIYPLENQDMLLLAVQGTGRKDFVTTHIKEVNVKCQPEKIEEMVAGDIQNFKFLFSNIFEEAKELLVEVDFGDGITKEKSYSNVDKIGIEAKHIYKDIKDVKFKARLYDVTGGKKEIISELVIPITADKEVKIKANHTIFKENESVAFKTNIQNKEYRYLWTFGDADSSSQEGTFESSFTYTKEGDYTVSVNVYDDQNRFIGAGTLDLVCNNEDSDKSQWNIQTEIIISNNKPVVGDKVSFSTNVYDSDYTYEWLYNGMNLNFDGQTTESVYVNYESGNTVLLYIKDKDGLEVDFIEYSFNAAEAEYDWVLVDTQISNAVQVPYGTNSTYNASLSDGLFKAEENYENKYTIKSELKYPNLSNSYKTGETVEIPLELVITNIDDLINGDNQSAVFRSLTFHAESKVELVKIDGTREVDGQFSTRLSNQNIAQAALTQKYTFNEVGPEYLNPKLIVDFSHIFLRQPGEEKKVATITFFFGKYRDSDAYIRYVFESKRSN